MALLFCTGSKTCTGDHVFLQQPTDVDSAFNLARLKDLLLFVNQTVVKRLRHSQSKRLRREKRISNKF